VLISVDLPKPVWPGGSATTIKRETRLTDADDVELEAALQQLLLNLRRDAVEADMALGVDGGRLGAEHGHCRLL
jgi:hypothetical protein